LIFIVWILASNEDAYNAKGVSQSCKGLSATYQSVVALIKIKKNHISVKHAP
jgi:hypothetical protein